MENQTSKPDDQHFDYLDGWRGLAIVFLLIGHFFPIPGINFGRVGVDFFFVLSGLLMSRLLFIKKVPIKTFYQRRVARIFPAHFVYLILILCYFLLAGKEINWSETLMAGLFVNNYFPGEIGHAVMPFGHIWSLSVEEHTYIGLSLIAIGVRQRLLNVQYTIGILVLISIVFGVSYWCLYTPQKLEYELWGHSEVSAFGILFSAFLLLLFKKIKIPTLPAAFYPALILLGLACYWWSVPLPIRGYIGVGLFAFVVNALPAAPSIVKNILSMRPLKMVGIYSFSIYLWQQVFYLAHHREGLPNSIALLLSLCCGITSYYLVENPFRRYINIRWGESISKASYKN